MASITARQAPTAAGEDGFDASSRRFEFTCMRCYQPLILDQSILDVTSAEIEDMRITLAESSMDPSGSLPGLHNLSPASKFARLPAPESSKQAYLRAIGREMPPTEARKDHADRRKSDAGSTGPAGSSVGVSKRRKPAGPGESYVLLPPPKQAIPHSELAKRRQDETSKAPLEHNSSVPAAANVDGPSALFDILSSHTPIDHPICDDCAKGIEQQLIRAKEDAEVEKAAYERWEEMTAVGIPGDPSHMGPLSTEEEQELREEESRMREELEGMTRDLKLLEQEEARLVDEEKALKEEEAQMEEEERRFLLDRQRVQTELREARDRVRTERVRNALAAQTLSRLEATDVYSEVFRIGHAPLLAPSSGGSTAAAGSYSGMGSPADAALASDALPAIAAGAAADARAEAPLVGTINGLRLGGRPIVDWAEINAALGMVALCIDRIAVKVGCTFERYKIVPLGSFSRVDELPPSKNSYELYASTDISPSRLLQNRRFNYALGGLLDCLKQLVEYGTRHDRGWAGGGLEIHKDRIGGHSIKLASSMGMSSIGLGGASSVSSEAEQSWTRALRAVLAVLKRILVIEAEVGRDGPRK